ncbi:MAG: YedE-related selenium metabolism membrane protein, partial [Clostridiales Family XIII bacterium]|nr:YedE-related selenium metabolism membrane protein [Clostridiales Family XIII bacterium]
MTGPWQGFAFCPLWRGWISTRWRNTTHSQKNRRNKDMHKVFQGPKGIVLIGAILGIGAILLTANGNPGNMAICAACFIRDIAGALHLHDAAAVQYLRPEILGIIFGAFLISLQSKEFAAQRLRARGLALRFLLGVVMMIGSLIFLGCPLRMIFRLSAGDLNALMGLAGFLAGIATAVPFLHRGFDLGQSAPVPKPTGGIMPGLILLLIVLGFAAPGIFAQSESGPGSMHAPILLSLGVGLVFGIFCQIGAVCTSGAFRDIFIAKSPARVLPLGIIFFVMLAYNVITGKFHLGFGVADFVQPIAHSNYLWNFLGLYAVGFAATLASGCPLRQMVLAGQGHIEAVVTFLG